MGESGAAQLGMPATELRRLLRAMLLARRFEEKAAEAYQMGKIGGFCHLYMGQEAVAVGAITPLRDDDYVIGAYRDHAQAIVRGMSPRAVMAELYGRIDGCSKGRGGSMHLFDRELNFLGGHAIVGGHLPLATGVGYAIRYREEDKVCLCFFGDSVVNIGAFHESLNMAAKWGLPVIYLCENNSYGMGTDIHRVAAVRELADRACAYEGMHVAGVDGMDVLAVRSSVQEAIERARSEHRPSFIEARCYRYMGHSMADPSAGTYRTREEVEEYRARDPIERFLVRLIDSAVLTREAYDRMDAEVVEEVGAAAEFADASPVPAPESVYEDVYSDHYPDDIARRDRWREELSP
ncbi:MAG: pyruvate dehydrogenase (acetyl-transferring) E1 component subunit alpha [Gemmatimonadota bacterium]